MKTIRNCGFEMVLVGRAKGDPSSGQVSIAELFELPPGGERELPSYIPQKEIVVYLKHTSDDASREALDMVEIRES